MGRSTKAYRCGLICMQLFLYITLLFASGCGSVVAGMINVDYKSEYKIKRIALVGPVMHGYRDYFVEKAEAATYYDLVQQLATQKRLATERGVGELYDVVPGEQYLDKKEFLTLADGDCGSNYAGGLTPNGECIGVFGSRVMGVYTVELSKEQVAGICQLLDIDGVMLINAPWSHEGSHHQVACVKAISSLYACDGEVVYRKIIEPQCGAGGEFIGVSHGPVTTREPTEAIQRAFSNSYDTYLSMMISDYRQIKGGK